MNHVTFYRNKAWLMVGVLSLALFLAACGGATETPPTAEPEAVETEEEAPTAESEAVETEEEEQAPTDAPAASANASSADGIIADTFPCPATIIPSDQSTLSIRFREPTTDAALMVGRLRPETAIRLVESTEVDGVLWYRAVNPANNTPFNYIEAQYIVLGEGCVSGADSSDDVEATEEMAEEVEATAEATAESD